MCERLMGAEDTSASNVITAARPPCGDRGVATTGSGGGSDGDDVGEGVSEVLAGAAGGVASPAAGIAWGSAGDDRPPIVNPSNSTTTSDVSAAQAAGGRSTVFRDISCHQVPSGFGGTAEPRSPPLILGKALPARRRLIRSLTRTAKETGNNVAS